MKFPPNKKKNNTFDYYYFSKNFVRISKKEKGRSFVNHTIFGRPYKLFNEKKN